MSDAAALLDRLVARGWTLAVAESLTGGLVSDAVVSVPGASRAMRGAVVAYDTAVKASVLGVDPELLARVGAVDAEVARQMARGVRAALATAAGPADVGIATTGVAGPDPQDGQAVGTVFVAIATPQHAAVERLLLAGDRPAIRAGATAAAIRLALRAIAAG